MFPDNDEQAPAPVPERIQRWLPEGTPTLPSRGVPGKAQSDAGPLSPVLIQALQDPLKAAVSEPLLTGRAHAFVAAASETETREWFDRLPLTTRTRNLVLRNGEPALKDALLGWSIGSVWEFRNGGVRSVVELIWVIEGWSSDAPDELAQPASGPRGGQFTQSPQLSERRWLAYGTAGTPLLPQVLRDAHARGMPAGLGRALGFAADLPGTAAIAGVQPRVRSDLLNTIPRWHVVPDEHLRENCFASATRQWAAAVAQEDVRAWLSVLPFTKRTRNRVLFHAERQGPAAWVRSVRITDIISMPNFGIVSLLDLMVTAEINPPEPGSGTSADASPAVPANDERPLMPEYASMITEGDPRFKALLRPYRSLEECLDAWERQADRAGVIAVLAAVEAVVRADSDLTAEALGARVLRTCLARKADRWQEAMVRRYGLDGRPPWTLDEAGASLGVSRERVRQIRGAIEDRLPRTPILAPAVDAVLEVLDVITPTTPGALAAALRGASLTESTEWHASSLRSLARVSGRPEPDLISQDGWIGTAEQLRGLDKLRRAAVNASNFAGCTDLGAVLKRILPEDRPEAQLAAEAVGSWSEVHWVDETHFWLDHGENRNRLVNVCRRTLTVCQPLVVDDLLAGVERAFAHRASTGGERYVDLAAPGTSRFRAFLRSHPFFAIEDETDLVTTTAPMPEADLGPEKMTLVGVLRVQPKGLMDRNALIAACEEAGMLPATVGVMLTYAECISNYGLNVWGLRGLRPSEEAVREVQAAARARAQTVQSVRLAGVTPGGRPWTARHVTPTLLYSAVMPGDWASGTIGGLALDLIDVSDGEVVGALKSSGPFVYGVGRAMRKHNVRVGHVIRLVADTGASSCNIEIGGEELLDEPFDWD